MLTLKVVGYNNGNERLDTEWLVRVEQIAAIEFRPEMRYEDGGRMRAARAFVFLAGVSMILEVEDEKCLAALRGLSMS